MNEIMLQFPQELDDKQYNEYLDVLTENYLIHLDTCSLRHDKITSMLQELAPRLQSRQKKMVVAQAVNQELLGQCSSEPRKKRGSDQLETPGEAALRLAESSRALALLKTLEAKGLLCYVDSESPSQNSSYDSFADPQLILMASKRSLSGKYTCIITEDKKLTKALLDQGLMHSCTSGMLLVLHIGPDGRLIARSNLKEGM